ncbi:hypothetical protein SUGI_0043860 [Cryptomeria japonica]|nr:hypothetical protein SUGI_0043860 [Cryptomeria japonica]
MFKKTLILEPVILEKKNADVVLTAKLAQLDLRVICDKWCYDTENCLAHLKVKEHNSSATEESASRSEDTPQVEEQKQKEKGKQRETLPAYQITPQAAAAYGAIRRPRVPNIRKRPLSRQPQGNPSEVSFSPPGKKQATEPASRKDSIASIAPTAPAEQVRFAPSLLSFPSLLSPIAPQSIAPTSSASISIPAPAHTSDVPQASLPPATVGLFFTPRRNVPLFAISTTTPALTLASTQVAPAPTAQMPIPFHASESTTILNTPVATPSPASAPTFQTLEAESSLMILKATTGHIKGRFESFVRMGLPSPFPDDDDSVAQEGEIVALIRLRQQDQSIFKGLSQVLQAAEINDIIYPLARLHFHLELAYGMLNELSFKEMIDLDQAFQNLRAQHQPSEEEWLPLQSALAKL